MRDSYRSVKQSPTSKPLGLPFDSKFFPLQRILISFIVLVLWPVFGSAQFQLSNRLDLYAGINGSFLQPAATVATPYNWDLNLVNVGVGFSNDYAFLANASAFGLLRDARRDPVARVDQDNQNWLLGDRAYTYGFITDRNSHFGSVEVDLLGPAFSIQLGEWTRLGAFARLRFSANARGVDPNFSYFPYDQREDGTSFNLAESFVATAVWSEYGFHLSHAFPVGDDAELRLGGNIRYILPIDGGYLFNPGGTEFGKINVDSISLTGGITEIAFSNGIRGTENAGSSSGSGIGVDFGAQYAWEPLKSGGYRYTVGLSVIDAGGMTFDQVAERHRFATEETVFIGSEDYRFVDSQDDVDEVIGILNEQFYGRRGVSLESNSFQMGLPTKLSAQFSYQPIDEIRLAAAYVGGVNLSDRQLKSGQQLALAAHFSRWWYGAGLTIAYHDWSQLNVGMQVRLGPLTFGTDRFFGTLAKARRFQAADFYLGLKLHAFGTRKENRNDKFRSSRGGKPVRCYQF
jgi:hypothetical protein